MGAFSHGSISEAVFLLSKLEPQALDDARNRYSALGRELNLGSDGGKKSEGADDASSETDLDEDMLEFDRAQVVIEALDAAKNLAERELPQARVRIGTATKYRRRAKIISLVCSSSVLGTLAIDVPILTIASALLALLASIGTLMAEGKESLLELGKGSIYEAYEQAGQAAYKAGIASADLRLLLKHRISGDEIRASLLRANALCEELNSWVRQLAANDPKLS